MVLRMKNFNILEVHWGGGIFEGGGWYPNAHYDISD